MENQKENIVQPYGTHGKMLTYAYGEKRDKLLFIDDVPNGLKCGCFCPCCGEPMVAKNGGKKVEHHFAHSSGSDCKGYYETALHILSKEIIEEQKCIMLPQYKTMTPCLMKFESVEVEERNDNSLLQPDCVGVTEDGLRLHIEIFVTHRVDKVKEHKLKNGNYNCLEIHIPRQFPLNKDNLKDFIIVSTEQRAFINYPYGDRIIKEKRTKLWENKHKILRELWKKRNQKIKEKKQNLKYERIKKLNELWKEQGNQNRNATTIQLISNAVSRQGKIHNGDKFINNNTRQICEICNSTNLEKILIKEPTNHDGCYDYVCVTIEELLQRYTKWR